MKFIQHFFVLQFKLRGYYRLEDTVVKYCQIFFNVKEIYLVIKVKNEYDVCIKDTKQFILKTTIFSPVSSSFFCDLAMMKMTSLVMAGFRQASHLAQ